MNKLILEQLQMLKNLEFQVDGKPSKEFPDSFSKVLFKHTGNEELKDSSDKIIVFADYMVNPYEGFDFHKKFNSNNPPPEVVMYGVVLRETEKMYYLKLRTKDGQKSWLGWSPKKSVRIQSLR